MKTTKSMYLILTLSHYFKWKNRIWT